MEAAAIAGKYVASAISKQNMGPVMVSRPKMLEPFREIDKISYKLGLPNMGPFLLLLIVIVIIIIIAAFIKKYNNS